MLQALNQRLTKIMPLITPISVVLGMLFQQLLASIYGQLIHRTYDQRNTVAPNNRATV